MKELRTNLHNRDGSMMNFDPKKLNALTVKLYGRDIGIIGRLAGDRHLFAFEQDYIDDPSRPTLSLSFKGETGGLVTTPRPIGIRLPPFFSTCGNIWHRAQVSNPIANSFFSPSLALIFPERLSSRPVTTMMPLITTMPTIIIAMIVVMMPRCGSHWPGCNSSSPPLWKALAA